jgi:hypothetical protein
MLNVPLDIFSLIIEKSELLKTKLCINCFREFGLNLKCYHYDKSEFMKILNYRLICKFWDKTIQYFFKNKNIKYSIHINKFNYSHATVHLVNLLSNDILDVTIDFLKMEFPYLIGRLRHGDIVENVNESGYRSDGVVMYYNDGLLEKLVKLNRKYDAHRFEFYGSPSEEFELLDFPGGYWNKPNLNRNFQLGGKEISFFRWGNNYPVAIIRRESLENAIPLGKKGKRHWWKVERNERRYLVSNHIKKACLKYNIAHGFCKEFSMQHQAYIIEQE